MPSSAQSVAKYFAADLAGSVVRFPYWWYTAGFVGVLGWIGRTLAFRWKSYGFAIWLKNFFTPMYGQYDWSGRIISVFMRFLVLLGRLVTLAVEAVAYVALAFLWLLAPPATFLLFLFNLFQS